MANLKDGGPAFPCSFRNEGDRNVSAPDGQVVPPGGEVALRGTSLRDYFAAHVQADDRLVKCVRAMDDLALEVFALHPDAEYEEHITQIEFTCWAALGSEAQKVARRLELEAHAIARVRYMQADAMLKARDHG